MRNYNRTHQTGAVLATTLALLGGKFLHLYDQQWGEQDPRVCTYAIPEQDHPHFVQALDGSITATVSKGREVIITPSRTTPDGQQYSDYTEFPEDELKYFSMNEGTTAHVSHFDSPKDTITCTNRGLVYGPPSRPER